MFNTMQIVNVRNEGYRIPHYVFFQWYTWNTRFSSLQQHELCNACIMQRTAACSEMRVGRYVPLWDSIQLAHRLHCPMSRWHLLLIGPYLKPNPHSSFKWRHVRDVLIICRSCWFCWYAFLRIQAPLFIQWSYSRYERASPSFLRGCVAHLV